MDAKLQDLEMPTTQMNSMSAQHRPFIHISHLLIPDNEVARQIDYSHGTERRYWNEFW